MKAYLIDAAAREVREVEVQGNDLGKHVGGYIEAAWQSPAREVLYVDEEGMQKPQQNFFLFAMRPDQPLAGNGVFVGAERYDHEGEFIGNDDPVIPLERFKNFVRFVNRNYFEAWGRANASEPASTIHTIGDDGRVHKEVTTTWGGVAAAMPKSPQDDPK